MSNGNPANSFDVICPLCGSIYTWNPNEPAKEIIARSKVGFFEYVLSAILALLLLILLVVAICKYCWIGSCGYRYICPIIHNCSNPKRSELQEMEEITQQGKTDGNGKYSGLSEMADNTFAYRFLHAGGKFNYANDNQLKAALLTKV